MATLEFVRTYLDDLLIITKGSLENHLEKLSRVLTRLQDAGLKINADKSNFCTLETDKETIMKKIQRLCDLGVLEWQPSSEWAATSFIQPKKNKKTVCFLTNFGK
jgi:hypothetical protein